MTRRTEGSEAPGAAGRLRRKWVASLACLLMLSLAEPSEAGPHVLVDAATGDILSASDPTRSWHPASLTKIMTAHLALLAIRSGRVDLHTPVTMSAGAVAQPPSRLGLPVGHALRMEDAIRVMLVRSANDVAVAVAEHVSGSEGAFVAAMNAEAERLGMTGTVFANATGLPDDRQVTNARDMAVLSMAVQRFHGDRYDLFRTPFVTYGGKILRNTNDLLGRYPGTDGMKTGYICASGFNIVASATRDGRRLIGVVLGAADAHSRSRETTALLDLGFSGALPRSNLRTTRAAAPTPVSDAPSKCARPTAGPALDAVDRGARSAAAGQRRTPSPPTPSSRPGPREAAGIARF